MSDTDRYGVPRTVSLAASVQIGRVRVDLLSDGVEMKDPTGYYGSPTEDEWMKALGLGPGTQRIGTLGCFLVRDGTRTVLIDTGWGGNAPEPPGAIGWAGLHDRMREAGARPADVDTIVHTHLHGDHIGGDLAMPAGTRRFATARVLAPQDDIAYWLEGPPDLSHGNWKRWSDVARPYFDRLRAQRILDTFTGEHAVTPSLTMIPTPGHTPGHCSALVSSDGEHLVITGDAAIHPVQFEHLDWVQRLNTVDPEAALRSRRALAALAVRHNALVTGGHFPILSLGRLRAEGPGYRWEPVRP